MATFRELDRSAREIAAWLSTRPEATRPVLLLFEPGIDFWRAFLGCLYAGAIAMPAPLPQDKRSMQRVAGILRDADSNLALTTAKLRDLLAAGIEGLGLARPIQCVTTDDSPLAEADSWTIPHITADAVAFLQYTSGSTGDPKGVAVTHGNVLNNEATISEALGVTADSVLVGWIPHYHDMGLIGQLLAFYNGANLITMSPLAFLKQPVRLLKAISDYRGTVSTAPNFAYDLIVRRVTRRATRRPGPLHLGSRAQRCRAGSPSHHRADQRLACSGRIRALGDASRLRHGRGDTAGHRQPWRSALPPRRRRRNRTKPLCTGERPRDQPREFRRARTRYRSATSSTPKPSMSSPRTRLARSGWAVRASPAATTTAPRRPTNSFGPTRPTVRGPTCALATSGYSTRASSTSRAAARTC